MTTSGVPRMRVGFIGGGAVGLYIGSHLARDGHEVTIIDGWAENVDAINRDGIRVVPPTCDEPFTQKENVRALHVHETHLLADGAEFDIGFVAMKIHDTRWAASLIDRFVKPSSEGGYVVASQNCWPDEMVGEVVGEGRAVGCVMSTISVGMWEAGLVERAGSATGRLRDYTVFRPAEHSHAPGAGISPRTVALAKMLEVVDKAEASPDLWSERWSKLCLNNMGNTPQAMSGMAGPEVNHTPEGRRLTILAAAETVKVGQSLGFTLGKVQGRPAEDWARAAEDEALFAELEAQLTPTTPPPAEPSRWDEKGTQDNWKVSMPQVRRNGESAKRAQSSALDSAPRMPNQVKYLPAGHREAAALGGGDDDGPRLPRGGGARHIDAHLSGHHGHDQRHRPRGAYAWRRQLGGYARSGATPLHRPSTI